jgi:hypothetical protein
MADFQQKKRIPNVPTAKKYFQKFTQVPVVGILERR